jgi:hypothetical protein
VISAVAAAVCVVVAGSLGFVIFQHAQAGEPSSSIAQAATDRDDAAAWVAHQVTRTDTVSCDPLMCLGLEAQGIAASDLRELKPGRTALPKSALIIATATVRRQLGAQLSTTAPALIASFGTGAAKVEVRQIAHRSDAAWKTLVRSDVHQRKESGAELLTSQRIKVAGAARRDLTAGLVDSRLLVTIAGFAALDPVRILAFGSPGPGVSAQISPFRSVDLGPATGHSRQSRIAFAKALASFLRVQRGPFAVAGTQTVRLPDGKKAVRIEFAAPSPLGLLTGALPARPRS